MVTSNNYGSSSRGAFGFGGVVDWIIQRKSAVILGGYIAYLTYFFIANTPLTYDVWVALFSSTVFKVVTLLVVLSLLQHAWVGIWTIATDYLGDVKIRSAFLFICKLLLLVYLVWTIIILKMV